MSTEPVKVEIVLAGAASHAEATGAAELALQVMQVRDAFIELVEAAGLRVDWINGKWYVLNAEGAAFSNRGHSTEQAARAEASDALRAALAGVGA